MAGFNDTALNVMVDALAGAGARISAHTADPATTGTSEVAYHTSGTRPLTTWAAAGTGATGGDRAGSQVSLNIPGGVTVTHWGIWSAATAGTFYGGFALTSAETFGSNGTLLLTPTLDVDQG
jgi:hypothetical protein